MKQEYDFRTSPKPLSGEEIARHKDFDALMKAHGSGNRRRGIIQMRHLMYTGMGLAAAAIALLLIFRTPQFTPEDNLHVAQWEKQVILPAPIPALQPPSQSLNLTATQETALEGNPYITIPADAFVDAQGQAIEGEVELRIRKLDDFVDFFLAGIKLGYDTPNGKRQLESAGMVEIYAEQQGKRVFLAPGKTIAVEFESVVQFAGAKSLPFFSEYYLDTDKGAWVEMGPSRTTLLGNIEPEPGDPLYKDKLELHQQLADLDLTLSRERTRWENANPAPAPPQKPLKSSPDRPTLELDFLEGAVPETASGEEAQLYKGAIWQLSPRNPAFDQRAFNVTWESARLRQMEGDDYELILSHGSTSLRLIVNPVLTGSAYEQAMNAYRTALAEYERTLKDWQSRNERDLAAIQQQVERNKAALIRSWEKQSGSTPLLRAKLRHHMELDRLGLWTVGHALPLPSTVTASRITDQHDNIYDRQTAYVVNPQYNTLHQVLITGNSRIPLAPGSTLWTVSPDGKVAVLRPQSLQKALSNVTSSELVLDLQDQQPATKAELRKILQL